MARSTGCSPASRPSSGRSRAATCCPAAWSCSMSRPPGWRAAAAHWRPTATAATTVPTGPRWCSASLTDAEGCPVATEAFQGNTADPATLEAQLAKLRDRFGLERFVLVGDRGMLTSARIERLRAMGGIDWLSALRHRPSGASSTEGTLQLSLFDERDLVEIAARTSRVSAWWSVATPCSPRSGRASGTSCWPPPRPTWRASPRPWPGARCGTPPPSASGWGASRTATRWPSTSSSSSARVPSATRTQRRHRRGGRPRRALRHPHVRGSGRTSMHRRGPRLQAPRERERDFRALKTSELEVRPIHHYREDRVRGHLFLCLLAAYVRWHLERAWAPLLFRDEAPPARASAVAPPNAPRGPLPRTVSTAPPRPCRSTASARCWLTWAPSPATGCRSRERRAGGLRAPRRGHAAPGTGPAARERPATGRVARARHYDPGRSISIMPGGAGSSA